MDNPTDFIGTQKMVNLRQMSAYLDRHLHGVVSLYWGFYRITQGQNCMFIDLMGQNNQDFSITILVAEKGGWPADLFGGTRFVSSVDLSMADYVDAVELLKFITEHYQLKFSKVHNRHFYLSREAE